MILKAGWAFATGGLEAKLSWFKFRFLFVLPTALALVQSIVGGPRWLGRKARTSPWQRGGTFPLGRRSLPALVRGRSAPPNISTSASSAPFSGAAQRASQPSVGPVFRRQVSQILIPGRRFVASHQVNKLDQPTRLATISFLGSNDVTPSTAWPGDTSPSSPSVTESWTPRASDALNVAARSDTQADPSRRHPEMLDSHT